MAPVIEQLANPFGSLVGANKTQTAPLGNVINAANAAIVKNPNKNHPIF